MKRKISLIALLAGLAGAGAMIASTPTPASAQGCGVKYMKMDTGWCNQVCCASCHCCTNAECAEQ